MNISSEEVAADFSASLLEEVDLEAEAKWATLPLVHNDVTKPAEHAAFMLGVTAGAEATWKALYRRLGPAFEDLVIRKHRQAMEAHRGGGTRG